MELNELQRKSNFAFLPSFLNFFNKNPKKTFVEFYNMHLFVSLQILVFLSGISFSLGMPISTRKTIFTILIVAFIAFEFIMMFVRGMVKLSFNYELNEQLITIFADIYFSLLFLPNEIEFVRKNKGAGFSERIDKLIEKAACTLYTYFVILDVFASDDFGKFLNDMSEDYNYVNFYKISYTALYEFLEKNITIDIINLFVISEDSDGEFNSDTVNHVRIKYSYILDSNGIVSKLLYNSKIKEADLSKLTDIMFIPPSFKKKFAKRIQSLKKSDSKNKKPKKNNNWW